MNGRERLERLAGDLEAYQESPAFRFRMTHWLKKDECGSSGCALGLLFQQPWAKEEHFIMTPYGYSKNTLLPGNEILGTMGYITKFFDIDIEVAESLFYPEAYIEIGLYDPDNERDDIEPGHVAERIRRYLKDGHYEQSSEG